MKRLISMILIAALTLTMAAGCGQKEQTAEDFSEPTTAASASDISAIADSERDKKETASKETEKKQASENDAKQTESAAKQTQAAKKETKKEAKPTKATKAKKETKKPSKETKTPTKSKKSIAQSYVGKSAGSLISAIGSPNSRSYAPSCMGEGEDGQLKYSGFTVYTYRENGKETVQHVE